MAYKTGWLKKVINGVSTKIFAFAHVKTVYTDYENGKLLSDKLTEMDDDIKRTYTNMIYPTAKYDCTEDGSTLVKDGVTCKNNGDGTYTLNGTSTATSSPTIFNIGRCELTTGKKYKLVGCPQGGSETTYYLNFGYSYDHPMPRDAFDVGNGSEFINRIGDCVQIIIQGGVTLDNIVFKPIVTPHLDVEYGDILPTTGKYDDLNKCVAHNYKEIAKNSETIKSVATTNIFHSTVDTVTQNGITCKKISEGIYSVTGTLSDNVSVTVGTAKLFAGKTYYLFYTKQRYIYAEDSGYNLYSFGGYTPDADEEVDILIKLDGVDTPVTINETIKILVTCNGNATIDNFVPYTGDTGNIVEDVAEIKSDLTSYTVDLGVIQANTQTDKYFVLPSGIDSSYNAIVSLTAAGNTNDYIARTFAYIINGKLRIGIKADTTQTYRATVMFVKNGGALTATT